MERPDFIKAEHLEYLFLLFPYVGHKSLRDTGRANMYGAVAYLEEEFGMSKQQAGTTVCFWKQLFLKKSTKIKE